MHFGWADQRESELRGKQREREWELRGFQVWLQANSSVKVAEGPADSAWPTPPPREKCAWPGGQRQEVPSAPPVYPPSPILSVCVCVDTVYVLSLISFLCHLAPQAPVDLPMTWILMLTCSRNTYLRLAAVLTLGIQSFKFLLLFFFSYLMSS